MEFNINNILKKKVFQNKTKNDENTFIYSVLKEYIPQINDDSFEYIKGTLRLKNISHFERIHIKRKKKEIIMKLSQHIEHIRDII